MQLKERVSAGLKIIGFYFFFVALERLISLGLSLYFLREDTKQGAAYLGQIATSTGRLAITRQGAWLRLRRPVLPRGGLICIKLTPALVRICVGPSSGDGETGD